MRSLRLVYRGLIVGAIIFSFFVNYYTFIVKKDYAIFTYPDGPDTSDYFVEE